MEKKKLYGRDREVQHLRKVFQRAQQEGTSEVVFLAGPCGTGKTTTVEQTLKRNNCLYGYGKFEREKVNMPFASLGYCVSDLGQSILEAADTEKYTDLIKSSLAPKDCQMLISLAPELNEVVPGYAQTCTKKTSEIATNASLEHFKFALRLLLRTISTPGRPVVLFMDDLQWMDEMTMEILKSIHSDPDIQHFVLAGAYRDDAGADDLHKVVSWIETDEITTIPVGNFEYDQTQAVLADILETKENIQELADVFHSRTSGNMLHILQLIKFLKAHNNPKLMEYSPTQFKYIWNIKNIRRYTSVSDDVIDIIVTKMHQLPQIAQSFLKLASCFGTRFDMRILHVLEVDDLLNCLDITIEQGLLERISDDVIKFVHDKVHVAAEELLPSNERTKMHFEIGKKLLEHFCGAQDNFSGIDDVVFFTCVDQLNFGKKCTNNKDFRVHLAKLNREAVVRAASLSAFLAAIRYAEIGISLLDHNTMWVDDYDFCLDLHTLLAEMCSSCGQIERLDSSTREVFRHARTIEDKLRAHFAAFSGEAKDVDRAIKRYFDLLEELGEIIPQESPKCKSMACLRHTTRLLETLSDDTILALPPMKSVRKAAHVRLISPIFNILIHKEMFSHAAIHLSRTMMATLEEGLSEYAPLLFANYGYMLISFDRDIKMACRIGSLAVQLLNRVEASAIVRIGVLSQTAYVSNWQQPLSLHLDQRIEAYQEGLRLGDLLNAFNALAVYGMEYFYSGLPLAPLARDMKKFLEQMASYNQLVLFFINLPLYQTLLNLAGESDDVLDICNAKVTRDYRQKYGWDGKTGMESSLSYGMQIAFFCGDMETADARAKNLKRTATMSTIKRSPWYYGHVRVFFFALIAIDKFRKTSKRKYLLKAKKYTAEIEECVHEGSINLPHKLQILEAELASLKDTCPLSQVGQISVRSLTNFKNPHLSAQKEPRLTHTLSAMYDKAISYSRRGGFLQDAALCAILASKAVNVGDNRYQIMAIELLESWGASAVSNHLKSKHLGFEKGYHTESNTGLNKESSGYRARSRFIEGIQKETVDF